VLNKRTEDSAGWFGKLSVLGDFGTRRLEATQAQQLDRWLSMGLRALQARQATPWLQGYLSAPVWRFAWAPGVMGETWWFGVLMPSCDNAGRYFPLWVGQARRTAPLDRYALDHLDLWWSHLAQCALATLGEQATLAGFESALADAPPWPAPADAAQVAPDPGGLVGRYQFPPGATCEQLARALAADAFLQRLGPGSFWWPVLGDGGPGQCRLLQRLPEDWELADMLQGSG
jgi:type VI secretion system protein ImpM